MSNRTLVKQFNEWRQAGISMALATVVHTEGSTYSKAGRQILICPDGRHAGLVSGGCLEGDLAEHARTVIDTGAPQLVTYDMRSEADDLWGIGLGCNGMMRILLQPLAATNDWQPFAQIAAAMTNHVTAIAMLVTDNDTAKDSAALETGSFFMCDSRHGWSGTRPAPDYLPALEDLRQVVPTELKLDPQPESQSGDCTALVWQLKSWPRLLLLGAGPDALPVVNIAHTLGWEITVADHRPQYFTAQDFCAADATAVVVHPDKLANEISLADYSAVVVMSHHFETDRCYLRQLADFDHPYTGVLGPPARKAKLLAELELTDTVFGRRLFGPVGMGIGADNPETIALALLAEIQSVLAAVG